MRQILLHSIPSQNHAGGITITTSWSVSAAIKKMHFSDLVGYTIKTGLGPSRLGSPSFDLAYYDDNDGGVVYPHFEFNESQYTHCLMKPPQKPYLCISSGGCSKLIDRQPLLIEIIWLRRTNQNTLCGWEKKSPIFLTVRVYWLLRECTKVPSLS